MITAALIVTRDARPDTWTQVIEQGGADAWLIRIVVASQARMHTREWARYLVGGG